MIDNRLGALASCVLAVALSGACAADARPDPVGDSPSPIEGGDEINEADNPISSQFPLSTVQVWTPTILMPDGSVALNSNGKPYGLMCTGEIIAPNKVLTAAHCLANVTTQVIFYPTTAGAGAAPTTFLIHSAGDPQNPPGVLCRPDVPGGLTTCSTPNSGDPSVSHFADLSVITLASDVPAPYASVGLAPRGSRLAMQTAPGGPPSSWEVGVGEMDYFIRGCNHNDPVTKNPAHLMEWVPTYHLSGDDSSGAFTTGAMWGDEGDSGGPMYVYGSFIGPLPAGQSNLMIIGIIHRQTSATPCDGNGNAANVITSVTYPDNYDWLIAQGASPAPSVPGVASFGASSN